MCAFLFSITLTWKGPFFVLFWIAIWTWGLLSSNLQGAEQGQKGDIPKGCPAAVSQQSQKGPLYFSPFLPASTLPGEDVRKRRNAKQRSVTPLGRRWRRGAPRSVSNEPCLKDRHYQCRNAKCFRKLLRKLSGATVGSSCFDPSQPCLLTMSSSFPVPQPHFSLFFSCLFLLSVRYREHIKDANHWSQKSTYILFREGSPSPS